MRALVIYLIFANRYAFVILIEICALMNVINTDLKFVICTPIQIRQQYSAYHIMFRDQIWGIHRVGIHLQDIWKELSYVEIERLAITRAYLHKRASFNGQVICNYVQY